MCSAFDCESTDIVMSLKPAHDKAVVSMSLSSDGSTLVSIGEEGQVRALLFISAFTLASSELCF